MHKKLQIIYIFILFSIVVAPVCALNTATYSKIEKRKLAPLPTFPIWGATGAEFRAYTKGIEEWLNDHIGFKPFFSASYGKIHVYVLKSRPHKQLLIGKNNRVYLASHASQKRDSLVQEVLGLPAMSEKHIHHMAELTEKTKAFVDNAYTVPTALLVIPQSHIIDAKHLPYSIRYFVREGNLKHPRVARVKSILNEPTQDWIIYPYQEAAFEQSEGPLYPHANFHWRPGRYTKLITSKILETFGLGEYKRPGFDEFERTSLRSDLNNLLGFNMVDDNFLGYRQDVLKKAGIVSGDKTNISTWLGKYVRVTNYMTNNSLQKKQKILIIGDSFSTGIATDLARYFSEALTVDIMAGQRIFGDGFSPKKTMEILVADYRPDYIIFEGLTLGQALGIARRVTSSFND